MLPAAAAAVEEAAVASSSARLLKVIVSRVQATRDASSCWSMQPLEQQFGDTVKTERDELNGDPWGRREGGRVSGGGEGMRLNAVVQIDIVPSQFRRSAARMLQQQEYVDLRYRTGTRWSVRLGQVYNIPQCSASHRQPQGP